MISSAPNSVDWYYMSACRLLKGEQSQKSVCSMLESFMHLGHVKLAVDGSRFPACHCRILWQIEASSSSSAATPITHTRISSHVYSPARSHVGRTLEHSTPQQTSLFRHQSLYSRPASQNVTCHLSKSQ